MHYAIAGAGLIGRLLSCRLLQQGHQVSLFDKESRQHSNSCGIVAAGMLAPFAEIETADSQLLKMGQHSLTLWPKLLAELDAQDIMQQNGSLLTAHAQDWPEVERFINLLQRKCNPSQLDSIQLLNKDAIQKIEPELGKVQQAYYLPLEGHINSKLFFEKTEKYIIDAGANWHQESFVQTIEAKKIICKNKTHQYDMVFDCRGLGAKDAAKNLRGIRGEIIHLACDDINIKRPIRLFHPRYRIYLVPQGDGIYKLGATEIESEDMSSISVRSTLELLSALYSIIPEFAEARIIKTLTQCRPAFSDNLPRIDYQPGLIQINGLYRHGYLLAPSLVENVMERL